MLATVSRVTRWEQRTELPLAIAAVAFLGAFALPVLDPGLTPRWHTACTVVDRVTWAVFALDILVRLALTEDRRRYASRHVLDLLVVALPVLRPLRLLRIVVLLRFLNRRAATSLRGRVAVYVSSAAALIVFCASLAVLDAERGRPGATITDFDDAAWWAVTTVTTVGYGDRYPVTGTGRLVAVGLMLTGIALIGVVTATIASWLLDQVRAEETLTRAATLEDLRELHDELRQLRADLAGAAAVAPAPPPRTGGAVGPVVADPADRVVI